MVAGIVCSVFDSIIHCIHLIVNYFGLNCHITSQCNAGVNT